MPATVRLALLIVIPYMLVIAPLVLARVTLDHMAGTQATTAPVVARR